MVSGNWGLCAGICERLMNVSVLHLDRNDLDRCQDYYSSLTEKGVYHSPEYMEVLQGHYQSSAEIFIYEEEAGYVYYPYFRKTLDNLPYADNCEIDLPRYSDIESSWYYGGPLLRAEEGANKEALMRNFSKHFRDYCSEEHIISEFVRYDPNIQNHLLMQGILETSFNRYTVCIDLFQSADEIWENMEGRSRTAIRKAQKAGIECRISDAPKDVDAFHAIYRQEMMRKGAPAHYGFDLAFIRGLFGNLSGRAKLFLAEKDKEFLGASLCLFENKGTGYDFLMASIPQYWKYQPNNLMLYEAVIWCKKNGLWVYDFQGGREGVFQFKKSFSKERRSFFISSTVHDAVAYASLKKTKERLFGPGPPFFPEYRLKDTN